MAKAGRPKSDNKKDRIISFRISDEDYLRLKEYAELHHITVSRAVQKGIEILCLNHYITRQT